MPEHLCVRCARHMRTCCQTSEIYVTPGDVARIAAHTGSDDFHERRVPDHPIYLQQDDDPLWQSRVFDSAGTRRVLKRHESGDCRFLGPAGCTLPTETRPLVCRLYPYDFNEAGIYDTLARGCPTELIRRGRTLLEELEMDLAQAREWHAQLYREVRLEPAVEFALRAPQEAIVSAVPPRT
jgi:Fe-S-cluster containining protein